MINVNFNNIKLGLNSCGIRELCILYFLTAQVFHFVDIQSGGGEIKGNMDEYDRGGRVMFC